ncbi:hypothetical protein EDD86DRAFT_215915 [Gorgonomyces haynaldii]|nr:hypothetical protein EDD86DRAFT_215915 [Gorgonomyces haynaldii]
MSDHPMLSLFREDQVFHDALHGLVSLLKQKSGVRTLVQPPMVESSQYVQSKSCYTKEYHGFDKCRACIRKMGEPCRFRDFRVLEEHNGFIQTISFLKSCEKEWKIVRSNPVLENTLSALARTQIQEFLLDLMQEPFAYSDLGEKCDYCLVPFQCTYYSCYFCCKRLCPHCFLYLQVDNQEALRLNKNLVNCQPRQVHFAEAFFKTSKYSIQDLEIFLQMTESVIQVPSVLDEWQQGHPITIPFLMPTKDWSPQFFMRSFPRERTNCAHEGAKSLDGFLQVFSEASISMTWPKHLRQSLPHYTSELDDLMKQSADWIPYLGPMEDPILVFHGASEQPVVQERAQKDMLVVLVYPTTSCLSWEFDGFQAREQHASEALMIPRDTYYKLHIKQPSIVVL